MRRRFLAGVLATFVLAACDGGASATPATTEPTVVGDPTAPIVEVTVFAAASLKGALEVAATAYHEATGVTILLSTDSSAALATKIEQGAPADVFLAADVTNPQRLVDEGLTEGEAVPFAANWLTIIVPIDNPGGVRTPGDLATPGLRIVAAGDAVPISKYAARLVSNLAALPGAPAGLEAAYAANVISKEENVKAVVAKIELGEGDAAIVYVSDAVATSKVMTVDIPDGANVMAVYAGVVLRTSHDIPAAAAFMSWLGGPVGRAILVRAGLFIPPA